MKLIVNDLSHAYRKEKVLHKVSFNLEDGEIGCLLGPSGSGKTTVLRCIAGFEYPAQGEITTDNETISSANIHLPPAQRNIGMMFQDYALLPHLTVEKNVAFGLHQLSKSERTKKVVEVLEVVGLQSALHKYPHQLSGGQQQRVALARAIAPNPRLILMDEPFSNLDVTLRKRLGQDIRRILKLLNDGELQQWDSAYNLYHQPVNRFVANFVGQGTFVSGRVTTDKRVVIELGELDGEISTQVEPEQIVDVLLRPDDIIHDDDSAVTAKVLHKAFRGADILYTLALASGDKVLSLVPSHHNHAIGEAIGIRLEADHVVAFEKP